MSRAMADDAQVASTRAKSSEGVFMVSSGAVIRMSLKMTPDYVGAGSWDAPVGIKFGR